MKISLFKSTCLCLMLIPMFLLAHDGGIKGKYTKEKTIKKEFSVSPDAVLKVDNSYGNLTLTSWNENRIVIEVNIKTTGNNEEKVQRKLDDITVDFEASNTSVGAKTNFNKDSGSWGWNWNNNNVNMQVNYTIRVPVKNSVHLSNDYGNINLDRIDGYAKINCDYGRLEIGELRGRNNQLSFDYTSKSTIGYINSGQISADYSGFTINKAGDLDISADYTDATILQMENLKYSSDYGNLEVREAGNVGGQGDYINVKLGTLHGDVSVSADYGSIKIDRMAADAGNIDINTDYTGIKIGYDPGYHFNFEITTEYAGVEGIDNFDVSISKEKSNQKYYKGFYGNSNSGNMISITSDYGSISFNQ